MLSAPAASEAPAPSADQPGAAPIRTLEKGGLEPGKECRATRTHYAGKGSAWKGDPVTPKKLTELPEANAYMAVYRTIDGCEVPMTVAEYRSGPFSSGR